MPSHRAATDSEKNLAVALIGGAFALIVATLWGGFGLFDKVSVVGQTLVVCAGVGGCMFLLGSIIFGGLGISYGVRPGTWNRFDWQAKLGISALVLLLSAPVGAFFTWQGSDADFAQEIGDLRKALLQTQTQLNGRLGELDDKVALNMNNTSQLREDIAALRREISTLRQRLPDPNEPVDQ